MHANHFWVKAQYLGQYISMRHKIKFHTYNLWMTEFSKHIEKKKQL